MDEKEENAYALGHRAAWLYLLHEALRALGYDDLATKETAWITEREAAIAKLRSVCDEHGDNDWPNELHLADIIEKHLYDYLGED